MSPKKSSKRTDARASGTKKSEEKSKEVTGALVPELSEPLLRDLDSDADVAQLSVDVKVGIAQHARTRVPLESLASWIPGADRPDPVDLLLAQETDRVQWLLPLRHGRMAVSPFTFYRGAAAVMASDLGSLPNTGLTVQLCGDAHLANFGVFGTPERRLVFDINDFDETLPGPWEWDVKRLVASLVIAARDLGMRKRDQKSCARQAAQVYREAMADFSRMPALDVFYASLSAEQILSAVQAAHSSAAERTEKSISKATQRTSAQAFERLTEVVDGQRRIKTMPPLLFDFDQIPPGTTKLASLDDVCSILAQYRRTLSADRRRLLERYRAIDVALKVVGVGSVGTRCFIALLEGADEGDPLFLQVKQAGASVLEPHLRKSRYRNHGQRVVEGQRLMQAASDIFLGWIPGLEGRDFYWRQFKDWKGSADFSKMDAETLAFYGGLCGWTLARAHSRSGSPVEIATYLGDDDQFDDAMAEWGRLYADQNEADYARFMEAIERGTLSVEQG